MKSTKRNIKQRKLANRTTTTTWTTVHQWRNMYFLMALATFVHLSCSRGPAQNRATDRLQCSADSAHSTRQRSSCRWLPGDQLRSQSPAQNRATDRLQCSADSAHSTRQRSSCRWVPGVIVPPGFPRLVWTILVGLSSYTVVCSFP